jgi:hypothetical protein
MKLGSVPRGLAVAALAAVTVVPFAATAASAAPAAPTAYTLFGSAQPLRWLGSSTPIDDLYVPFVEGKTSNLALARADAKLGEPTEKTSTLSGETIHGLTCAGYPEKACQDPFVASAQADHGGVEARHSEQSASFGGRDGKFPGRLLAMTDCAGACGDHLVRSLGTASGPAGGLPGYVSIGSSAATQDLRIDEKGRLISTARSELTNVSIGPKNEVHFSSLMTSAEGFGSGAANTKDGKADLRITDFFILDNQVELDRAGLRLANAGPSEQEAYDGAKVLLQKLRERGIILELPDFNAQLTRTPDHVAVDVRGLRVRFEQAAGPVQAGVTYPLELGHATAVVAAVDADRHIDVSEGPNGRVVVQNTAPTAAQPPGPAPADGPGPNATGPRSNAGTSPRSNSPTPGGTSKSNTPPSKSGPVSTTPAPPNGEPVVTPPVETGPPTEVVDAVPAPENPDDVALPSLNDIERNLGLRGANSVSRAFGAFLGLGLILPLARFVIRRLG